MAELDLVRPYMRQLSSSEQQDYRQRHFRHRLTLLPCFSQRRRAGFDWNTKGDLFRCAKRPHFHSPFFIAMGLKGYFDPRSTEILFWDENAKLRNCRDYDDILIDQLGGTLPNPSSWSLSPKQARLLAGVYKRANKELAHLPLRSTKMM